MYASLGLVNTRVNCTVTIYLSLLARRGFHQATVDNQRSYVPVYDRLHGDIHWRELVLSLACLGAIDEC